MLPESFLNNILHLCDKCHLYTFCLFPHFVLTGTWRSGHSPPFHRGKIQAPDSQGLVGGAAPSGLRFRPLVSCPGLSSLHQGCDSNILQMSCGNDCMKCRLFSKSVRFWPWKDLRDSSNIFFSFLKCPWRKDDLQCYFSGPWKDPKLFPPGTFSRISLLLPPSWRSSCRTRYGTLTGWSWQKHRHWNRKGLWGEQAVSTTCKLTLRGRNPRQTAFQK